MFTGIIEDVGTVRECSSGVLTIETRLSGMKQGDSIAVNGICLTVTAITQVRTSRHLRFDFSPETGKRTTVGDLKRNSLANLERALQHGDRLGGHFMTGHIEGTARLLRKSRQGNSWIFAFSVPGELQKYIVPKGSIGVDGISLTVVESSPGAFTVSVIPHTLAHTNLGGRRPGDRLNIEPDILAKYVEGLLQHNDSVSITAETLRKHGFLS